MKEDDGSFWIKARRCKRCGGILTSKGAVEDGYGCVCKKKAAEEGLLEENFDSKQVTLEDLK